MCEIIFIRKLGKTLSKLNVLEFFIRRILEAINEYLYNSFENVILDISRILEHSLS